MIRISYVMVLVILLSLLACQPSGPKALSDEDKAEIEAISQTWMEAARAGNWKSLAEKYTENAVFMPPNQATIKGRANIQEWFEALPPVSAIELELIEIDGVDELAYVRGTYTMALAPKGMEPIPDSGKFLEIRRKQMDGSWLLTHDIFNSDLPAPK